MSKGTKLGYGFLLVGIGAPYLIDSFFGSRIAFVVAFCSCLLGIGLLFSGHTHERHGLKKWQVVVPICLMVIAVGGSGWRLFQHTKPTPELNTPPSSPPNVSPLQEFPDITWHSPNPLVTDVKFSKVELMASVTVDTASIPKLYWKEFSLLLILRPVDDSVDALTDTRIEKSQAFAMTGETRTIQVNLSKEFFRRAERASKTLSMSNVGLYVGLIPKSIRPEQILTVTDITALGGKQLKIEPEQNTVRNHKEE